MSQLPNTHASPPLNQPTHGINLTVETNWNKQAGYHPLRLRVDRASPSQSDTTVTIQFTQSDDTVILGASNRMPGYTVLHDMDLPASASQAESIVNFPYFRVYNVDTYWEVYVDGSLAEELCGGYSSFERQPNSIGIPRFLFVEDKFTYDIAQDLLASAYPLKTSADLEGLLSKGPQSYWGPNSETRFSFLEMTIDKFPQRARDYSNLDIIYLSKVQFQDLQKEEKRWAAIHQWVATGGNVWITGVDLQADLTEIELAFGLSSKSKEPAGQGWQSIQHVELEELSQRSRNLIEQVEQKKATNHSNSARRATQPSTAPKQKVPQIPEMRWRSVMMGQVRLFSAERPFAVQDDLLTAGNSVVRFPYTSFVQPRESWQHRHGLTLQGGNTGFWNWLIPSVGLPPVTLFQILIALFVIGIGPVNYILLRRVRRLQLLLVTVPMAALLITAGIFAYSLLTDGLSTRLRTRSYTEIDQTSGLAVAWSRHSYYSGLAPEGGMTFPTDTIVYPIQPAYNTYGHQPEDEGVYEIQFGSEQYLTGDWLPSRVPKQYLTVRSVETKALLHVEEKDSKCEIRNELKTQLKQLLVIGADGKFYSGEQIADGASTILSEISQKDAIHVLAVSLNSEALEYPVELERMDRFRCNPGGLPAVIASAEHLEDLEVSTELSLLEMAIGRIKQGSVWLADSPYRPGRYIAIVDDSPLGVAGVKDAVEQGSLHVISGRWK